MKQVFQDLASGTTEVIESPSPSARRGMVLIDSSASLISTGTERMLVDFGRASLLSKARQQPEKVAQVLEKAKTEGILATLDAVKSKLEQPLPLGYCNVGIVRDTGGTPGLNVGDRVVSNGPHGDVVRVPSNLVVKVPDSVSNESASFAVAGGIGLQGIRLAEPTLGEAFVVMGVGLIGLLTARMLVANGCRVLAIDFDESKLAIAKRFGAEVCNPQKGEDPLAAGMQFSLGRGVDGVIICASTTSNEPISSAAKMCRKRGRIVLVGVAGLELNRSDFYEKEITFQVSCSYGPGRYDKNYEEGGQDYPFGFVRWTEQRNIEAVLGLMDSGVLDPVPLISHRFDFSQVKSAYDLLASDKTALAIVLNYGENVGGRHFTSLSLPSDKQSRREGAAVIGVIGAGNYASRMLIPAIKKTDAALEMIASSGGTSGTMVGRKYGFKISTTDTDQIVKSNSINSVVIATQHNSHASLVVRSLQEGKNVFVEKPLALTSDELNAIEKAHAESSGILMVGFNRRFSPLAVKMKELLSSVNEPISFVFTMNAGVIPADHWTQDVYVGGGRIIGEACHHIDLMRHFAGSRIQSLQAVCASTKEQYYNTYDVASISLTFENGSMGTVHYFANGGSSFPKERIEAFTSGRVLQLDNFRQLRGFNWPGFKRKSGVRQDKGQNQCMDAFISSVASGKSSPIPFEEIMEVSRASIEADMIVRGAPSS